MKLLAVYEFYRATVIWQFDDATIRQCVFSVLAVIVESANLANHRIVKSPYSRISRIIVHLRRHAFKRINAQGLPVNDDRKSYGRHL